MSNDKMQSAKDIRHGIDFCKDYILQAMFYANDRSDLDKEDFLNTQQFNSFYERTMQELERLIEGVIEGEPGIDTYDQTWLHESAKEEVMGKLGMDRRADNG